LIHSLLEPSAFRFPFLFIHFKTLEFDMASLRKGISMNITKAIEPVWNCIEAARFLRLHPKTVKRMARQGQIPGRRLGRRWFFRPSDLDAMLRSGVSSSEKANRVAPQFSS
jgi:excisionase family DNA binding protein